jgi:hypothetical protein
MTAHIEEVDDGNFARTVLASSRPVWWISGRNGAPHAGPLRRSLKRSPSGTPGMRRW